MCLEDHGRKKLTLSPRAASCFTNSSPMPPDVPIMRYVCGMINLNYLDVKEKGGRGKGEDEEGGGERGK